MKTIWDRIHWMLRQEAPEVLASLAPGATEEQIAAAENAMRVKLPEEVKVVYRIHNGQLRSGEDRSSPPFLDALEWCDLERVVEEWRAWKDLLDVGVFAELESESEGPVRADWWHPCWIPLTHDSNADSICLDLAPAPGGRVGQIIHVATDDPERPVFAESITAWLSDFANELEEREWVRDPEGPGLIHINDL